MNLLKIFSRGKKEIEVTPTPIAISVKRGKSSRRIIVTTEMTFGDLDLAIRKAFGYDMWDHCAAFFDGPAWRGKCLAEAYPDNRGPNQLNKALPALKRAKSQQLTYLYDYGANRELTVVIRGEV
jgi:hypothetical protein